MALAELAVAAETATHARSVEAVTRSVNMREPLIVVTGEEGTGKTTLCQALSRHLGLRTFESVILEPPPGADALRLTLLVDFGIVDFAVPAGSAGAPPSRHDQDIALRTFLESLASINGRAVVIIDDAQDISSDVLKEMLRVCSVDANQPALLQLVLVGRPSFDAVLERADVRRWLDRFTIRRHRLLPLAENEIKQDIERRLWRARGGIAGLPQSVRAPRLTRAAVRAIARASRGNPRLVSAICDRVLAIAEDRGPDRISGSHAKRLVADLGLRSERPGFRRPSPAAAAVLVVTAVAGALLAASLRNGERTPMLAVVESAAAVSGPAPDQAFQAFRTDALDRAAHLTTVPDVKALLKLEEATNLWDRETSFANHSAIKSLLIELERLTNEARQRQLDEDRRLFLESSKGR